MKREDKEKVGWNREESEDSEEREFKRRTVE